MRNVFIFLAVFFILITAVFAILPMGTLGFLPAGLAILFSGLAFMIAEGEAKKFPKWLLIVAVLLLIAVIGKSFIKDEVASDEEFEQRKIESQKEDIRELEALDELEASE